MRRTVYLVALATVVLTVVSACSSDPSVSSGPSSSPTSAPTPGSGSDPGSPGAAPTLAGQTFVSTSTTGHDLVTGSPITLSFTDDAVSATAGCNTMNGSYTLDGATLRVGPDLASTMMGCEDDLMAQDTWLTGWLSGGLTVASTPDGMTLEGQGTTVVFGADAEGATGMPTLVGPTWTLETIGGGDSSSSVPVGVAPPTLVFAEDGTVAVFTGCDRASPTAVVGEDGFITFEPMVATTVACEPDAVAVAVAVTSMLDGRAAFGWSGDGDLSLAKDGTSLVFTSS